jgi:glycerate dehydrogenase
MKIIFLDAHTINPRDLSWESLRSLGELQVFDRTPENEIVARARDADVLLTMRTPLSAETMSELKRLGHIAVTFPGTTRSTSRLPASRRRSSSPIYQPAALRL